MQNASRRDFLVGAGAAAILSGCHNWGSVLRTQTAELLAQARAKKINILYIMTDDHAAHAISAYGSRVNRTPGIDRLAKEGMIFSDVMCTNPICGPSRASILTGRYSHMHGVPTFVSIDRGIETVGGHLRRAGYYTAFLGKWHVGGPKTVRDEDWDRWMVYENQGVYFDPYFMEPDGNGGIKRTVYKGEYATENLTRLTMAQIDAATASGKPFFIMMHHKAPHRNWLPSKRYEGIFRRLTLKDIPMPETIYDTYEGRATPIRTTAMTLLRHMRPNLDLKLAEYFSQGHTFTTVEGKTFDGKKNEQGQYVNDWPEGMTDHEKVQLSYLRYMQDYLACVQSVDDSVADMQDFLKARGLEENTLVVYTADQGFFLGDHGLYDKRFIMEETLKMPFLAKCPAFIPAGSENHDIITNVDFAPTFMDLAGAPKPAEMQGDSFLANMAGHTPADWKDACYARYYVEGGEHQTAAWYGVRTKTDKLVYYYKRDEWEYFDLEKDPEEVHNGYGDAKYARRIAELKGRIAELRTKYGDTDQFQNCHEYSL